MEYSESTQVESQNIQGASQVEADFNPDGFFSDATDSNACSVRVAVRVRPLVGRELFEGGQRTCVDVESEKNNIKIGDKNFGFDKVFAQTDRQCDIFDVCARNLVLGCFAGFNATILAYGQTGSGKTHTMGTGSTVGVPEEHIGIVPRVFGFIFEELQKRKEQSEFSEFTIKVQFLELYNEELHDLLDPSSMGVDRITGKPLKELQIREEKNGTISIQGLKEEVVNSREECLQWLNKGIAHRTTSATLMNEGSSRSHAIFTVAIEQRIVKDLQGLVDGDTAKEIGSSQEELITAKFHFVDLAGSERIKRTGATGQVMKEGISINKGLLALGNVISALTEESKKDKHIPYRDSKLTRILQDSLGGNSRTTMIACVSPAESNYEESLNAVKYASRARNIKNKPVVNRDPNSVLIDSLKSQISTLQGEITGYQQILKENNIELSETQLASLKAAESAQTKTPSKAQQSNQNVAINSNVSNNNFNFSELREVKIKLSKKEKELKDVQEQLAQFGVKYKQREQEMEVLVQERDNLRLKNEILAECLEKNNLKVEGVTQGESKQTMSLIDEYKAKLQQLEQQLEKKDTEIQTQSRKIGQIQVQQQRDEELLRKHLEENQRLKRQIKKFEESGGTLPPPSLSRRPPAEPKQEKKTRADLEDLISKDLLNDKFMSSLANQLESIFVASEADDAAKDESPAEGGDEETHASIDEKEKILEAVKNSAKLMQGELVELMKNEYEKKIQEIEKEVAKVDQERQSSIKNASADTTKVQALEVQYKQKMEDLQKQLKEFKDKERKQETISKQINAQESKIKAMENDLLKVKKGKEQAESQMKQETEKFNKFKKQTVQELNQAKKAVADKEKVVQKLKADLKKTDQLAQNKLAELRGLQKRAQEERHKRELAKREENESKGIDIDRIKAWINENTNKMLECRDLKDQLEKQVDERERIEDEMLEMGDKLTDLVLEKERKEAEKSEYEVEAEVDEGKMLEVEQEIENIQMEMQNITDSLDNMDETLDFINKKINMYSEEIASIDIDNIQPLQFSGLKSVDAAKVTLQTFFGVLLDLNIYKRDLEQKCIEQDEEILSLNDKIKLMQTRVEELLNTGNVAGLQALQSQQDRVMSAQNTKALKSIVESLDGFVEYSELKNLNLTASEQNSLTKLSLSKIVSNLKTKLKEEETKNQNLSHKLEQAINEKDKVKMDFNNFKKQKKQEAFNENPLASARGGKTDTSVPVPTKTQGTSKLEFKFKSRLQPPKKEDVPAITVSKPTHSRNSTLQGQNSMPVGKNMTSILPKKTEGSNSVTRELKRATVGRSNIKTPRKMDSGKEGNGLDVKEIRMALGQNRPQTSMAGKIPSLKDRRAQKKQEAAEAQQTAEQSLLEIKVTDMQTSTTTKQVAQPAGQSLKDRRAQRKQEQQKTAVPANKPAHSRSQSNVSLGLKRQSVNPADESMMSSQPVQVVPSLKDKRNQRKQMEHKEEEVVGEEKFQELDNIKDASHMAAQEHNERQRSKVRAYSKLKERGLYPVSRQNSGHGVEDPSILHNIKGIIEETIVEVPTIMSINSSPDQTQKVVPRLDMGKIEDNKFFLNIESGGDNDSELPVSEQDQPMEQISPSKDDMNKWTKDELLLVENRGHKLVDFDTVNGKLMLVFENFNVEEYDIETEQQTNELNLKEVNGEEHHPEDKATALTVDKELGMIAVGSNSGVFIFDYQDDFTLVTKIDQPNVTQICFCQFNVVVLAESPDSTTSVVTLYSLDDDFQPVGSYTLDGTDIKLKSDTHSIYYSQNASIGKLLVPDLTLEYLVDTDHSGPILDFSASSQSSVLFTTSADSSLRCLDKDNGAQVIPPIEDLECDSLEAEGQFILTRCGGGAAFLVWKQTGGVGSELTLIDEIEQEQFETEQLAFRMKGGMNGKIKGLSYNMVVMVTTTPEAYIVQALKHKPLYC